MSYTVSNNLLHKDGVQTPFEDTKNKGAAIQPRYLILHYTAGLTASGAISWFKNPESQASAHLVIDRNGAVTQMVPFNRKAWHAGNSSWNELVGLNGHSIGIEIVNAGKLNRTAAGKWRNWAGNEIPEEQVVLATHKHETREAGWHAYTEAQLNTVAEIGTTLHRHFGFLDVLGHDDVSPRRKVDPGPAFPMTSIASRIMGRRD